MSLRASALLPRGSICGALAGLENKLNHFIERSLLNVLSTIKENSIKSWGWSNFYQLRWKYENSKSKENNDDDDNNIIVNNINNNSKNNADVDDADDASAMAMTSTKTTTTAEEIETDLRTFSKQLNQDLKPRRKIKLLCWASKLVPQSKVRSETYGSFLASGALV